MKLRSKKKEPYGYRPAYFKSMDEKTDSSLVLTPPMLTGFSGIDGTNGPPPEDKRLKRLAEQFRKGKISCRETQVAMFWIRPYADYEPYLTPKFRKYIEWMRHFGENYHKGPIPIVLYQLDGQLIMGGDYKTYYSHRREELWTVEVLILGEFTERDFCFGLGEPFKVDSLDLTVKDELMDSKTRRLALLMRGDPLRVETKEQIEAINKKDFDDAIKAPIPYEPEWSKAVDNGEDPPALHSGHFFGTMPEDVRYTELATQAQAGVLECQLAMITFIMMRPYSDFKPTISKELRNEFEVRCVEHEEFRYKENDVLRITVYEYEPGHFMVANNEENLCIYQLYREKRQMSVNCIILGPYTKTWAVLPIDKPFEVTLSEQAGYDPEKTMKQIGKRIYNIMLEKGMHIDEVSRLTGIPYEDLHDMMHDSKSQSLTIEQLERIARVLGIKASDIVPF